MSEQQGFFGIYQDKRWLTFSNVLTGSRILLAPCVIAAIYFQRWHIAFMCFVYAAATDFFDGYIARLFKDQTYLGKVLDPLADKIFLVAGFGALAFLPSPLFPIPWWFFALIIVRETIILIGSYVVMRLNNNFMINPTMSGKISTCFQLVFIMWLFLCYFVGWCPLKTYGIGLIMLVLVASFSLLQYVSIGFLYWFGAASRS